MLTLRAEMASHKVRTWVLFEMPKDIKSVSLMREILCRSPHPLFLSDSSYIGRPKDVNHRVMFVQLTRSTVGPVHESARKSFGIWRENRQQNDDQHQYEMVESIFISEEKREADKRWRERISEGKETRGDGGWAADASAVYNSDILLRLRWWCWERWWAEERIL